MEELIGISNFYNNEFDKISLFTIVINFTSAILISYILKHFYVNYSQSLTGKYHVAPILPILTAIIFMVIIVVKSSLALSLGLVGALSIVRFRTPIKEPEELIYIFFAIAIGLGFGANFILETTIISSFILAMIYFISKSKSDTNNLDYNFVLDWENNELEISSILKFFSNSFNSVKIIRLDNSENSYTLVLQVSLQSIQIDEIIKKFKKINKKINISFFESRINW